MSAEPFPIERDRDGRTSRIAVVRLEQPGKPVVVLDRALIDRLRVTLESLPKDCGGLVLASASERVFVAGADLKSIVELDDAQLDAYLTFGATVFGMLSQLPFPTAAAINGAALGGGLELAMHCDGLIACPGASGKSYPVGLPEASLAICPGWGGTNLLPARIDPARAIRATALGAPLTFEEARDLGMFDRIAATPDSLIAAAKAWILESGPFRRDGQPSRHIGRGAWADATLRAVAVVKGELQSPSARVVVAAIEVGLARGWSAALEHERRELIRLRSTPAGKDAIAGFFARSAKKEPAR